MKKGTIVVIVTVSLVIVFTIGWFIHSIVSMAAMNIQASKSDSTREVKNLPTNYLQLFKNNKLSFDQTIINNFRKPISEFTYKEKFLVTVYEIDTLTSLPVDRGVIESYTDQHVSYYVSYSVLEHQSQYEIEYKSGRQDKISKIYVNLFGDSIQTLSKNANQVYYYGKVKNFSIRYQDKGRQDFYGSIESPSPAIPLELMLYKKQTAIYLLLMVPFDANTRLQPGTLGDLIAN
jgi:hypothetical protein